MTFSSPPVVADPARPTTDIARDANAHNGVAAVTVTNGYAAIDNGAPIAGVDTDADGLTDDFEKLALTDPLSADTEDDGLTDGFEALQSHTDPLSGDTDSDGIDDAAEVAAGSAAGSIPGIAGVSGLGEHAQNVRAGVLDTDLDGLSDLYEIQLGTNPDEADTDFDELPDNVEVTLGTTPTLLDGDGDGITDGLEVRFGSNPLELDAGTGYQAPRVAPPEAAPPAPDPSTPPVGRTIQAHSGGSGSVQQLIDVAMQQVGDDYFYGANVAETDPDPQLWDCAEFTQWSAYQVGAEIPGSSYDQYLDLKAKGLLIPVEEGMNTPGALLFHFSSEPEPGGGRPSQAHVALSLGEGRTVEAQSEDVGVITDDAAGRFEYAALLPNVDYAGTDDDQSGLPDADADPAVGGVADSSGLTLDMVIYGIKMQESRGDYQADNLTSTASGAYQYLDGTWDNYQGYAHAGDAPDAVQDAKMRADTEAAFAHFGDWERVIAAHFAGEGEQAGPKSDWDKVPGHDYNQNPSIRSYVDGVMQHIEEADPAEFGPSTPQDNETPADVPISTLPIPTATAGIPPAPILPAYQIDPGVDISDPDLDGDNDGLTNRFEQILGSNPTLADSDLDGLIDSFEATLGTDPMKMDTDLDGFTDGIEVDLGRNPLAAGSGPATGDPLGAAPQPPVDAGGPTDDDPALADVGLGMH